MILNAPGIQQDFLSGAPEVLFERWQCISTHHLKPQWKFSH